MPTAPHPLFSEPPEIRRSALPPDRAEPVTRRQPALPVEPGAPASPGADDIDPAGVADEQVFDAAELAGMVRILAHDLRNPLQTILLCCDALRVEDPGARRALEAIRGVVGQIDGLVSDVLDPHFQGRGVHEPDTHVGSALQHAVARHAALASLHGVLLRAEPGCRGDAARVAMESPRLQRALANLLTNGIRCTPPGGRVTLSCSSLDGAVAIFVSDTGCGIPEDAIQRVFESTEATAAGSLQEGGLHIVRRIVERAGGRISVASREGHGTTFTIVVPQARRAPAPWHDHACAPAL
jgi:signal transduction histidine kinase